MIFNTGSVLLDTVVLAVVFKDMEGTYGYKITQGVRQAIDTSESILYPVLRRFQKEDYLEVYNIAIDGRNHRYYRLTERSRVQSDLYRREWVTYSRRISRVFEEAKLRPGVSL